VKLLTALLIVLIASHCKIPLLERKGCMPV